MKATWSEQLRREPAAAALAIFALSTVTILGAWFFQYVLKLQPCPLCLEERLPYHIVIPLSLLVAIAAFVRAPRALIVVGFVAILATVLCGAGTRLTSGLASASGIGKLRGRECGSETASK